jgi:molybdopterin synthase catalytic subunit
MTSDNRTDNYLIKVSENMPPLDECVAFVTDPSCGAVSTFLGITRNNFQGKIVTKLSYEGYVPMAEKELRKVSCQLTCKEVCINEHVI